LILEVSDLMAIAAMLAPVYVGMIWNERRLSKLEQHCEDTHKGEVHV